MGLVGARTQSERVPGATRPRGCGSVWGGREMAQTGEFVLRGGVIGTAHQDGTTLKQCNV